MQRQGVFKMGDVSKNWMIQPEVIFAEKKNQGKAPLMIWVEIMREYIIIN